MKVYHYRLEYIFVDKKKSETGQGTMEYSLLTPYSELSDDVVEQIKHDIAYKRKHESVFIYNSVLVKTEVLS